MAYHYRAVHIIKLLILYLLHFINSKLFYILCIIKCTCMSDAYIRLIYLASAKNFLYDKKGMQRQQTVTRISLNISQGQKRDLF